MAQEPDRSIFQFEDEPPAKTNIPGGALLPLGCRREAGARDCRHLDFFEIALRVGAQSGEQDGRQPGFNIR
jgi:hypothetical protein